VRVWDPTTGTPGSFAGAVFWSPGCTQLVLALIDGTLVVLSATDLTETARLHLPAPSSSLSWNGELLAAACGNSIVLLDWIR